MVMGVWGGLFLVGFQVSEAGFILIWCFCLGLRFSFFFLGGGLRLSCVWLRFRMVLSWVGLVLWI